MSQKILVLGATRGHDFAPLRSLLGCGAEEIIEADVETCLADKSPAGNWFPDLCLVAQQWPDEFSAETVIGLLNRFPLARLLCVHGPWCEADGRTRDIWPTGCRVSVAHCATRIQQELESIRGDSGSPVLPLTASRSELFAAQLDRARPNFQGTQICIDSPDRAWAEMLAATIQDLGGSVVNDPPRASAVVFDLDPPGSTRLQQFRALRARVRQCRILRVTSWPCAASLHDVEDSPLISRLAPLGMLLAALCDSEPIQPK